MDPNAWAVGPLPVSHFLAKAAARWLLLLGLRKDDPGFSIADGHRPRLWPGSDGSGGLVALEQRWQELYTSQCLSQRARDGTGRRRVEEDAVGAQPAVSVAGRVHPLLRAAANAQRRGQLAEGFADASDALLIAVLDGRAELAPCVAQGLRITVAAQAG